MRKILCYITCLLAVVSFLHADTTDERAILRFDYPIEFCKPCHAANVITETGENYWRFNGTYGFIRSEVDRLKFTGEFLCAKNEYQLEERKVRRWMNQIAFGTAYQRMLCHSRFLSLDLGASYGHAYGRKIHDPDAEEDPRITSTDIWDISFGTTMRSFCEGLFSVYGTWDYVDYHREFKSDRKVKGLGWGFELTQPVWRCVDMVLKGDFRRPYNFFEGQVNWNRYWRYGIASVGAFGTFVEGKNKLKNEVRYGLEIGLDFGPRCGDCEICPSNCCPTAEQTFCCLNTWVASPAVFLPRIIAIVEEETAPVCVPPTLVAPNTTKDLSSANFPYDSNVDFNLGTSPVTYTSSDPTKFPVDASGVVSSNGGTPGDRFDITVSNACGSAQQFYRISILY